MNNKKRGRALNKSKGFTLIELLVVMGILAVLATATALIINPANMLAQARDARRVADINKITKGLDLYDVRTKGKIEVNKIVYISIPDLSPSCLGYPDLPALTSGWSYACAPEADYKKTDGTGWLPLDFSGFTSVSFTEMPVDPKNNETYYYTYSHGRITSTRLESQKFLRDFGDKDGGNDPARFEIGNFDLWEQISGLVSYWGFDEGSGLSTADSTINNNGGALQNGTVWMDAPDCVVGKCLNFDGINDLVNVNHSSSIDAVLGSSNKVSTLIAWAYPNAWVSYSTIFAKATGGSWSNTTTGMWSYTGGFRCVMGNNVGGNPAGSSVGPVYKPSLNSWHHVACVSDGSTIKIFIDGVERGSNAIPSTIDPTSNTSPLTVGRRCPNCSESFPGRMDELRIYNRALSASEIQSIYNAQK